MTEKKKCCKIKCTTRILSMTSFILPMKRDGRSFYKRCWEKREKQDIPDNSVAVGKPCRVI